MTASVLTEPGAARAPRGVTLALVLVALVVWVDQATLPTTVVVEGPDGSFQTAFEHFFETRARAGVDWVFTYGPLGILQTVTYDPELFWGRLLLVDVAWKGLCALVLARALARLTGPVARTVAVLALVLLPLAADAYFYLVSLAAVELVLDAPRRRARAVAAVLVLVPLGLAKFTSFVLGAPLLAVLVYARWRTSGRAAALRLAGGSLGFGLLLWIGCGQSPLDLPAFVARSLAMALAYGDTMNTEAPPGTDDLVLFALAVALAAWLLPLVRGWREPGERLRALVRAAVLVVAYKAGVVRGFDHTYIFFVFAALFPFLLAPASAADRAPGPAPGRAAGLALGALPVVLRGGALMLAWHTQSLLLPPGTPTVSTYAAQAGVQLDACWNLFTRPLETRRRLDAELELVRVKRALPRCRAVVGGETFDIQPAEQDVVLRNGFTWRPRPVFVPYATLTVGLEELNARFLASDAAPRWFLLAARAIDGRLETMEDAAALQVLARDYRPVLEERGYLLLQRAQASGPPPRRTVVLERELPFGERLDLAALPGEVHLLQLEAPPTLRGRLRGLLLRPAEIHARIGAADGRELEVRLVPRMLEGGAIVDPVLANNADWVHWYAGLPVRARSLVLLPPEPGWAFAPALRVRIVSVALERPPADPDLERRILYPTFHSPPRVVESAAEGELAMEAGEPVLVLAAPATLRFLVGAGQRRVSGAMGLLASAYDPGASDGVTIQAQLDDGAGEPRTVFLRRLDPRSQPGDRGVLPFEFEFATERPGELCLRVRPGPFQDAVDDRAFFTRVRIE